ncbi:hypothetical protein V2P58_01790 [Mycoplasma capricolum subsp. capricolum]|uniref:hypothetical protein n=1 Tax=Mycoplasma capricolum TaxID=2095 RepID=UPI003DA54FF6
MKKLLVLLSGSALLSLNLSFISFFNSMNNSNKIVLKQEKDKTDLEKIFGDRPYVFIMGDNISNLKNQFVNALKTKYKDVDISELIIDVKSDVVNNIRSTKANITARDSSKYKGSVEFACYTKKDLEIPIKNISYNLNDIEINTEEKIYTALKEKNISRTPEEDIKISEIRENSAVLMATEIGNFYGKVQLKFNAKKKTLESVFYNFKLELKYKPSEDDVIKFIKIKKPKLNNEKLTAQINLSKNAVIISVDNSSENYQGSTTLLFALPEEKQPITPNTPKTPEKPEPSQPKNESKSNDILPRSEPNSKISTPSAPIIDKTPNKFEIKKPIPTIPNNTMNKSDNKTNKSGNSKTGIIVGTTLVVSSIVASGAAGSWLYFKKRK